MKAAATDDVPPLRRASVPWTGPPRRRAFRRALIAWCASPGLALVKPLPDPPDGRPCRARRTRRGHPPRQRASVACQARP